DVFARTDEILGVDLTQMMLCGPEDELTATKNAQLLG
ncbi:MAG: malonyl CoA-acyl carrier protein transacylase, partial [Gemmatimonadetes bacterium]|nr:malonyl CoA-acyl carrier protein transacylase [Gemmatimonadota bacterium]